MLFKLGNSYDNHHEVLKDSILGNSALKCFDYFNVESKIVDSRRFIETLFFVRT